MNMEDMVKEANIKYEVTGVKFYEPGEGVAADIGFTKEKFKGYIVVDSGKKRRPELIFSMVISIDADKGNFKQCVVKALEKGYKVIIPTPLGKLETLLVKWKFKRRMVRDPMMGMVEIWEREKRLDKC